MAQLWDHSSKASKSGIHMQPCAVLIAQLSHLGEISSKSAGVDFAGAIADDDAAAHIAVLCKLPLQVLQIYCQLIVGTSSERVNHVRTSAYPYQRCRLEDRVVRMQSQEGNWWAG